MKYLAKYLNLPPWHGLGWPDIWISQHYMVWAGQVFESAYMTWFGLVRYLNYMTWHGLDWWSHSKVHMLMPAWEDSSQMNLEWNGIEFTMVTSVRYCEHPEILITFHKGGGGAPAKMEMSTKFIIFFKPSLNQSFKTKSCFKTGWKKLFIFKRA